MHDVWFIHTGSTNNTWNRKCVEECGKKIAGGLQLYHTLH